MSDVITALRQIIQDLVSPDLKAISAKQESMEKRMDLQHEALMKNTMQFVRRCAQSLTC